jgi:hypothetical protein
MFVRLIVSTCVFVCAVTMPDGHVLDLLVKYVGEQEQLSSLEVDVSTDPCVCLFVRLSARLCACLFVCSNVCVNMFIVGVEVDQDEPLQE